MRGDNKANLESLRQGLEGQVKRQYLFNNIMIVSCLGGMAALVVRFFEQIVSSATYATGLEAITGLGVMSVWTRVLRSVPILSLGAVVLMGLGLRAHRLSAHEKSKSVADLKKVMGSLRQIFQLRGAKIILSEKESPLTILAGAGDAELYAELEAILPKETAMAEGKGKGEGGDFLLCYRPIAV